MARWKNVTLNHGSGHGTPTRIALMRKTTTSGVGEDLKPLGLAVPAGGSVGSKTVWEGRLIISDTIEHLHSI